jgi:hypothetical protein
MTAIKSGRYQLFPLDVFDDVRNADRQPIRVTRSFELGPEDLVLRALLGAEVHAPFGQDDAALAVDRILIERGGVRPVFEDEQRAIEHATPVGRYAQCVLRVVVARRRVGVRTDRQTQ